MIANRERPTTADLPPPGVTGCCFDEVLLPRVAAMILDWHEPPDSKQQRIWYLPAGFIYLGPAPSRFGIQIYREESDAYAVRLVWNDMQFGWKKLSRRQLLESSLGLLLGALGTCLEYLLDQPVCHANHEG
jgi:hypothetical protein